MPAFNEVLSISQVVQDFLSHPLVHEVIVIDNNSTDGTGDLALEAGAIVVTCGIQGFGSAIKAGMHWWLDNSKNEYLFLVESDGTFSALDLSKFIAYRDVGDVVLGSRTSKSLIWSGAYMPGWVRLGNWFVAKFCELLFNGPSLTDIGCTAKLLKRNVVSRLKFQELTNGSHFNEQILIDFLEMSIPIVEIPVNYMRRIGHSKITGGNMKSTLRVGITMILDICIYRVCKKRIM